MQQHPSTDQAIGPRVVGGTYHCAYWRQSYTVEHIGIGPESRITWSPWSITVRWSDGHATTHCTAWSKSDKQIPANTRPAPVLTFPAPGHDWANTPQAQRVEIQPRACAIDSGATCPETTAALCATCTAARAEVLPTPVARWTPARPAAPYTRPLSPLDTRAARADLRAAGLVTA